MPAPSQKSTAASDAPRRRNGVASWMIAGLVGMVGAVTVALVGPFDRLPLLLLAMTSVGAGWLVMVLVAPWRQVMTHQQDLAELRQLSTRLRRIAEGERMQIMSRQRLAAADEIGELGRALDEVLRVVVSNRSEAKRLERQMGHEIQRETHRRTARLQREAVTDPLTGLGNRRAMEQSLQSIALREPPLGTVVALVADLDYFKQVNDALGHDVGDGCLQFLGNLLKSSVRRDDTAIRLGGDEFVVIMPDQTPAASKLVAERLCSLFAQMPWPHEKVPRPTLSIGLALAAAAGLDDGRELLRRADEALYRAKSSGRAHVVMASQPVAA